MGKTYVEIRFDILQLEELSIRIADAQKHLVCFIGCDLFCIELVVSWERLGDRFNIRIVMGYKSYTIPRSKIEHINEYHEWEHATSERSVLICMPHVKLTMGLFRQNIAVTEKTLRLIPHFKLIIKINNIILWRKKLFMPYFKLCINYFKLKVLEVLEFSLYII